MIKEAYCSYEIYKLLREKGFDGEIHTTYDDEGYTQPSITHQMAMAWLREKGIFFCIHPDYPVSKNYIVEFYDDGVPSGLFGAYEKYEDAVEAAIEYSLRNLI